MMRPTSPAVACVPASLLRSATHALTALLALVVIAGLTAPTASAASCRGAHLKPSKSNMKRVRAATLCLLNKERAIRGLHRLRSERALRGAGQRFARAMVRDRFFSHVSPSGRTLMHRVKSTSYLHRVRRMSLGENIAWGAGRLATPARIVDSWMHSPGHRRNILDGGFREIGIGIATGTPSGRRGGATYVTDFGWRVRR